jgi:RNA polymerase sigma-70 factor (ECF subfamily)
MQTNQIFDEDRLIEGLHAENRATFEYVFRKYFPRIHLFAFRITNHYEDSQDIAQDVFLALFKSAKRITSEGLLKSILFKMTRNACFNYIKHKKVEQKYIDFIQQEDPSFNLYMLSSLEEREAEELRNEIMNEVMSIVSTMGESVRKVFVLSKVQRKKNQEIAEITGLHIKTVEKHLSRAMKRLKSELTFGSEQKRTNLNFFLTFF